MIWNSSNKKNLLGLLLPLALGISAFFVVAGTHVLNPENIAWLAASPDPMNHYLGWLFYRNSAWEFPVGLNSSYGLEIANSLVYSDSTPLLAIFLKPFSFLLPQTFQYTGIWLLSCFALQALFGWKLVSLVTSSNSLRLLGAGLIVFSPPMIWRSQSHFSLAGHFLIVASLYLAFNSNLQRRKLSWGLLIATAALVHAYLLAMVLIVWIADLANRRMKAKISWHSSAYEFFVLSLLMGFLCWQAGYFSVAFGGTSAGGFGFYRMNVLSPINSSGWSYILKAFPQAAGDYEGFNYLGLGTIFLLLLSFPFILSARKKLPGLLLEHWLFFILFFALFLFAITNSFAIGSLEYKYYLPDLFIKFANIFRSSGRMFWPAFYALTFFSIYCIIKSFGARTAVFFLGIALSLQILDTSAGWLAGRNRNMIEPSSQWESPLVNQFWIDAASKYKNVRRIPIGNNFPGWLTFAHYAGSYGLSTDSVYLARISPKSLEEAQKKASKLLKNGVFDHSSIFILDGLAFREAFLAGNPAVDLFAKVDGFNVLAPAWKACADCRFYGKETSLQDLFEPIALEELVTFASDAKGVNYLLTGWSGQEPWGTWSEASSAAIFLPIAPTEVDSVFIDFNAVISPAHPTQRIEIAVNGIETFSTAIKDPSGTVEIKLPDAAKSDSFAGIKMEFRFPDAARPIDIGLTEDKRTLAFGLRSIKLKGLLDSIALGETLTFASAAKGVNYLLTGWSGQEPWGTWSEASSAAIFLPIAPTEVDSVFIDFDAAISPAHPTQRIEIAVNGIETFSTTIKDPSGTVEIKLPDAAKSDSFAGIKMEFRFPDAARPIDIGLAEDRRTLAFGLRTITLK